MVILAGPNGAGKSTVAPILLRRTLGLARFVNADTIAHGLSAYAPESVVLEAGRIMLARLRALAAERVDFAFETTLATRGYAPWLAPLAASGYRIHLIFLWLPSPDLAVGRVTDRVRRGGHDVPEAIIRRRYARGMKNFFELYQTLAESWAVYDNTDQGRMTLIASGRFGRVFETAGPELWERFRTFGSNDDRTEG